MNSSLYIPLLNSAINEKSRTQYLEQLAQLNAKNIFIALDRSSFFARGKEREESISKLKDNVSFFQKAGLWVGVWMQAFGFGDSLNEERKNVSKEYIKLRSVSGKEAGDAFCPESEAFMSDYKNWVRDVAKTGCDALMLDDDLCMSVRPGIGCFCEKHLALLETELGESLGGKNIKDLMFTGGKNRYRSAWLKVMGKTLRDFAKTVRSTVDEIAPNLRVGFCAGYTSWDIEGVDALELTKILAGNTKPFLRFTSAPYWASRTIDRFDKQPLAAIIEEARAQEFYSRNEDVETFSEADSYPRPRYSVPSSLVECFSLPLYASGNMGELAYLMDYYASPAYEKGYIRHRLYNMPLYKFIEDNFSDKESSGVRVYQTMKKIENQDLSVEESELSIMTSYFNRGAELLGIHGIPTVYGQESDCGIAFGEEAKYIDKLPKKLIVDVKGALILKSKGIDVGLVNAENMHAKRTIKYDFEYCGDDKALLTGSDATDGYYDVEIASSAKVLSEIEHLGKRYPTAYTYTNGTTEFLVYTFDAGKIPHSCSLLTSYIREKQLAEFCSALPHIEKAPGVYQIFKRSETETAILFVNINEDPIFDCEVILDREYGQVELCGAQGVLEGNKLCLSSVVAPFGAFAAVLRKP